VNAPNNFDIKQVVRPSPGEEEKEDMKENLFSGRSVVCDGINPYSELCLTNRYPIKWHHLGKTWFFKKDDLPAT
jgi:hypothetical protein